MPRAEIARPDSGFRPNGPIFPLAHSLRGRRVYCERTWWKHCGFRKPNQKNQSTKNKMKLHRILPLCGILAALCLSAGNLAAQDNNHDNAGGETRRNRGGQGGNFDPAQIQQRMMERVRENLGFTNDTDWSAVQPLVQKAMDARREVVTGSGLGRMLMNRNRGADHNNSDQANRRGGVGQQSPEAEALQAAIDAGAPAGQIKDLLAKYQASQKAKQAKLEQAQTDLRKVLTVKQEAQATLMGLLN
jgi:hypothetical protein